MKLVCSECGQGDFAWSWKVTVLYCDFCKKITKWLTPLAYQVQKRRREAKKNGIVD